MLAVLLFGGVGVILLVPGLPGFLGGELSVWNKGHMTTYTGNKALIISFGMVLAGAIDLVILLLLLMHIVSLPESQQITLLVVATFPILIITYIISLFVRGTRRRD